MKNKDFIFAVVTNNSTLYQLEKDRNLIKVLKKLSIIESNIGKIHYYINTDGQKCLDIEYPPIINTTYTLKK